MKSTKQMTPRSIMNQRKAVESRGSARIKTPSGVPTDENKKPIQSSSCSSTSTLTPGTPTSHFMWKGHSSRRDCVTPLGNSGISNRKDYTPSTPSRKTPVKSQQTPTKSEKTVLFEFEDSLLMTPGNGVESNVTVCHTATVQLDPASGKSPAVTFNRSRSASSLLRTRKCGKVKIKRSLSEARIPRESDDCDNNTQDGEVSRINVGVRVRPLQPREYGNTVTVKDNEVKVASELGLSHSFVFDNVFGPESSQESIYTTMVKPLVDSAFQGYNACLFAYGQTGSGKTYSMMGPDTEVDGIEVSTGIIPRFCHEIIERVALTSSNKGGGDEKDRVHKSITVEVSYLEVYNEKIRDLLISPPSGNLRVREHPVYGPYVADLSKHTVNTISDIQHFISEGNKQKVMAATEMNEKSSRSHALFMVVLTQTTIENDEGEGWANENTKRSQISLVDLAGSERLPHSAVSLDRLREGVNINRSLLSLGKVITALVEKRSFVPYRDSVLTWLLKESLGGNSRTAMMATVSPCSSHQDETIATLRYATQARAILNTVRVNESPQNKIIRELRAEIERLKVYADSSDVSCGSKTNLPANQTQEINYLKYEIENLKTELAESEKKVIDLEIQKQKDYEECNQLKNEYNEVKNSFEQFLKEQDKYIEACNEKEKIAEHFKNLAQCTQNEKTGLQKQFDLASNEVKILKEMVQELSLEKDTLNEKLQETENKVFQLMTELDYKNNAEIELKSKSENLEKQLNFYRENDVKHKDNLETDELNNENKKLISKINEEKSKNDLLKNELDECKINLDIAEEEIKNLNELKLLLKDKELEIKKSIEIKNELENKLQEIENELDALKNSAQLNSDHQVLSVSVQTSVELPVLSEDFVENPEAVISSQRKEYIRLKKRIADKKKKLELFNAKLMKYESDQLDKEKLHPNSQSFSETACKIIDLEETLRKRDIEIEDMKSELLLLRELETKYKNKLDQSLQDSEEAWIKKYNSLNDEFSEAKIEITELKNQLKQSQDLIKTLNEQLHKEINVLPEGSNTLANQILNSGLNKQESVCELTEPSNIEILEQKVYKLQLKIDQKNNLIKELEKISNRAKEDAVLNQTYAVELKKKYESLESNLKEKKIETNDYQSKMVILEDQMKMLVDELTEAKKEKKFSMEQCVKYCDKYEDLQNNLKEKDKQILDLHSQLGNCQKLLQEQMSIKLETFKSICSSKKDVESDKEKDAIIDKYKEELDLTKEQLSRKKKRLEKMKSNIDKLEDFLVVTMRQSSERINYSFIKNEHAKIFECMMENSYLFHWEYLLRKARTYAHKYHIPYEFERHDENTAIVRHLLYNAKSYWFRIDFKFWFENIEKNDKWCRDYDEKLAWEVDFGSYFSIPNDKSGSLCPLDESSCKEIETYCCQPGLICPSVWKRTIVHRHLNGLLDDARCLLIYFKSSNNENVIELLHVINNLAKQVQDLLSVNNKPKNNINS